MKSPESRARRLWDGIFRSEYRILTAAGGLVLGSALFADYVSPDNEATSPTYDQILINADQKNSLYAGIESSCQLITNEVVRYSAEIDVALTDETKSRVVWGSAFRYTQDIEGANCDVAEREMFEATDGTSELERIIELYVAPARSGAYDGYSYSSMIHGQTVLKAVRYSIENGAQSI